MGILKIKIHGKLKRAISGLTCKESSDDGSDQRRLVFLANTAHEAEQKAIRGHRVDYARQRKH